CELAPEDGRADWPPTRGFAHPSGERARKSLALPPGGRKAKYILAPVRTPATPSSASVLSAALAAFTLGLMGCSTPIASGLEEPEANRVMLALDRAQVASSKETDATSEGRFRVIIAPDDAARALVALRAEELPRRKPASMSEATQKGGLV